MSAAHTYVESVVKASAVVATAAQASGGLYLRSFQTSTGFSRIFDPTITSAYPNGGDAADALNLPKILAVVKNNVAGKTSANVYDDARPWYRDGGYIGAEASTGEVDQTNIVGTVKLILQFASYDLVHSPSVQMPVLDQGAVVVLATGGPDAGWTY